jgi:uncharacterized membrane protein YfcA
VSPAEVATAIGIGVVSGILAGLFGVGGGIVMTPGFQVLLGLAPIVALATPLPVILPTATSGALRYRRDGELDLPAAGWMMAAGIPAAIIGALATELVDARILLLVTAALLGWQSVGIIRGAGTRGGTARRSPTRGAFLVIGVLAGLISGLLGIGGGLVMVPAMAGFLGMPLRRALGTSLAAIVGMVIPGTIVHAALGNIDWAVALLAMIGAVPGARAGAALALGTRERTLRWLVGSFMLLVAVAYGIGEARALVRG